MLAEITDFNQNELELKLQEEDISIMYIIQYELLKERNVEFAGVTLKHPLIRDYTLRIVTKKGNPIESIRDVSITTSNYLKEIASTLKTNLKK
jgi:DNA-directed RNA polymerase subunit L